MVIEEGVLTGRIKAPGFLNDPVRRAAWLGVNWIGSTRISLDPRKEADADKIDMETGAKTLEQVVIERTGGDWDQKTTQRAKEVRKRRELGLETDPATVATPASGTKAAAAQPEPDEDDPQTEDA